jgi:hypothetical protein
MPPRSRVSSARWLSHSGDGFRVRAIATKICCVLVLCAALSCGGASPTSPAVAQVAGTWTGTVTLTGVAGGECIGPLYQEFVGQSGEFEITIAQTGDSLASTVPVGCSYIGTAGPSSFTLNSTTCVNPVQRDLPCQITAGGGNRDLAIVDQAMTGTIDGNKMSMTITETDNVSVAGTNSSVGTLKLTLTVQAAR